MAFTIAMRAPNSAPQVTLVAASGNVYVSDLNGIIAAVQSMDVSNLERMGCTGITYSGLPLVAGRFYGGNPMGATQAAVLTVTATIYAYPIFVPNAVTLKSLNLSVTTGQTGGKGRAALFYDSNGYPGAIVPGTDSGDLDGTATAVVTKSFGASAVILQPGWYWVGQIYAATSTMPSVIGTTATYPNALNALMGSDTAAHALATSGQVATGISKATQTYPAVDMYTSFPTFPAAATQILNATCPVLALGV